MTQKVTWAVVEATRLCGTDQRAIPRSDKTPQSLNVSNAWTGEGR